MKKRYTFISLFAFASVLCTAPLAKAQIHEGQAAAVTLQDAGPRYLMVRDYYRDQPAAGVAVSVGNEVRYTNKKGIVDLSSFSQAGSDTVHIRAEGFEPLALTRISMITGAELYIADIYSTVVNTTTVTVAASRFEENLAKTPNQVDVLSRRQMESMNQPTTAEVLSQSGKVFVQKSQLGGGSPVLRGFEANKILLVVDGVRMNNAIYRAGHLQNILTVDNNALQRIEVISGPGSVLYGSDAMGGVIAMYTPKPKLAAPGQGMNVSGGAFLRASSGSYSKSNEQFADNFGELSGNVNFNIGLEKFAFLTNITYSDFGNLRQGAVVNPAFPGVWDISAYVQRRNNLDEVVQNPDPALQVGSAYKQYNLMEKILYKQNDNLSHTLNFQYSTTSDVNRYDQFTQMTAGLPKYAEWYYGPAKRLFASYQLDLANGEKWYNNAKIIAAYQDIEESRHDRSRDKAQLGNRYEKVKVLSLNADFEKSLSSRSLLRYGVEAWYNDVQSSAYGRNIITGEEKPISTRYPDGGSQMASGAAYITHRYQLSPALALNTGLRYSVVSLSSKFTSESFYKYVSDYSRTNSAANGNIGLVYSPREDIKLSLLASSGFRAPALEETSKMMDLKVSGGIGVPNPEIRPEYIYNLEAGIEKTWNNVVKVGLNAYYDLFTDIIELAPGQVNGQDSIQFEGATYRVLQSQNFQNGYVAGGTAMLGINAGMAQFSSSLTYTYGRVKSDGPNAPEIPLSHVPPMYGRTGVLLQFRKLDVDIYTVYAGWKYLKDYNPDSEDNLKYATPLGTPAWMTLNTRATYSFAANYSVQAAVENIFDVRYRPFASGISAPGRQLIVTLRARF